MCFFNSSSNSFKSLCLDINSSISSFIERAFDLEFSVGILSYFFIGNSSSGIIECAYLKTPFINLGNRQKGRSSSINVLNSSFDKKEIKKNIIKATSKKFREKNLKKINLIYGNGTSYIKAYNIIKSKIKSLSTYKVFYD